MYQWVSMYNRLRIGLFFGGEAVEHEVSIISALQAYNAIDQEKYVVVPVYISKKSEFYTGFELLEIENYKDMNKLMSTITKCHLVKHSKEALLIDYNNFKRVDSFDLAITVTHGTTVEDGVLQGLLSMLKIPYAGSNVAAAAVGQDKVFMKNILRDNNVPVTNFTWFYSKEFADDENKVIQKVETKIKYPVIIKPANLGSSVGISIAKNRTDLIESISEAINYDTKILVEEVVENMVEVNCSVLGDYEDCKASVIEEVMAQDEILSYKDKYQRGGKGSKTESESAGMASVDRIIPARISDDLTQEIKDLSIKTFKYLGVIGVSRIDYLIDQDNSKAYVNEINTIPGSLSFYLWEKDGVDFTQLTEELIQLAIKKERQKQSINFSFETNILEMQSK
jgi:D-alanine-D-alanine ligase